MAVVRLPEFRTGNVLSTIFTGTLTERRGDTVERIPIPSRFVDWCVVNGLPVESCTAAELAEAKVLREAIHDAFTALSDERSIPAGAIADLNRFAAAGTADAFLTPAGEREWRLGSASVADALRVIATDAMSIVSGERGGRLARCDSPTCREPFLDTSRSRTRRWCDMNVCGNREKKARLRASRSGANPAGGPA